MNFKKLLPSNCTKKNLIRCTIPKQVNANNKLLAAHLIRPRPCLAKVSVYNSQRTTYNLFAYVHISLNVHRTPIIGLLS